MVRIAEADLETVFAAHVSSALAGGKYILFEAKLKARN